MTAKTGVLVAQVGTPSAPTARALRPYLRDFLSDPRLIPIPKILWWLILNFAILPLRPRRSAKIYAKIWQPEGSPLLVTTRAQTKALEASLGTRAEVALGMRYGSPSIKEALENLIARGCERVVLFPLYPQYSSVTTASTYDSAFRCLSQRIKVPSLDVIASFFRHPAYVSALEASINDGLAALPRMPDYLLLSFHGIPLSIVKAGDPYPQHCDATVTAVSPLLTIPAGRIIRCYQSRFGHGQWLEPYTEDVLSDLARRGVKRVAVACPGFTADCSETLYDVGVKMRDEFLSQGGEELIRIPCLNLHPRWLDAMLEIIAPSICLPT